VRAMVQVAVRHGAAWLSRRSQIEGVCQDSPNMASQSPHGPPEEVHRNYLGLYLSTSTGSYVLSHRGGASRSAYFFRDLRTYSAARED